MKLVSMWIVVAVAVISVGVLSACGGSSTTTDAAQSPSGNATGGTTGGAPGGFGPSFLSAYLTTTYESSLPSTLQLELGTLELEGSPNAVSADQSKQLLPLYQALKGNTLQNQAEIAAVYKQIETTMTPAQMQAIAGMQLTRDSLSTWAQAHGVTLFNGTPGPFGQGNRQGGQGNGQATPDPTRVALRGELQNLSPEARATRLAELGFRGPPGGGQGQNRGRFMSAILDPLIKLLTARAANQ